VEIREGFVVFLQNRLYRSLAYADWLFMVQRRSSDLTHALTSDIQRIGGGTMIFLQFLSSMIIITVHIAVAGIVSFPLTCIALVFAVVMLGVTRRLNREAYDTGVSFRSSRQNLYAAVMEHLLVMKTAKSYGVEKQHIKRIESINKGIETEHLRFSRIRAVTRMYYEIAAVIVLSIFLAAAVKVIHVPVTRLFLLVLIFARLLPKFSRLQQHYQQIKNMLPAFSGVMQLYHQASESEEKGVKSPEQAPPPRIKCALRFQNVWFRYPGDKSKYALENATFDIPAQKITAIMGPSGAGKSTLADLLLGLLKPGKGEIQVDDMEITADRLVGWRHSIGYVPQETFLFHDTIRDNMLWANPSASEDDLWEALRMAAAGDFVKQLPKGLDTVIGDRGVMLSGGERQRIALARALLRKPQLLLLDEATSALDSENEKRIYRAIESLKGKLTIVIIAHRLSTLQRADRVILLDNGRVMETGSWESLSKNKSSRLIQLFASIS
jgi:ATP-binding cassette subfamily C protein